MYCIQGTVFHGCYVDISAADLLFVVVGGVHVVGSSDGFTITKSGLT